MQVNDERTHVGIVDSLLCLGLPRDIGAGIIREDANNVDLFKALEFATAQLGELSAKYEMQQLFFVVGSSADMDQSLVNGQCPGGVDAAVSQAYAFSVSRSRTSSISAAWRAWPAAISAPCASCGSL